MSESIVITGASSGIGKALAKYYSKSGKELILVARNNEKLVEVAKELKCPMQLMMIDLSKTDQRRQLIELIQEKVPSLVINNAGFGLYGPITSHSIEEELSMVQLNVNALFEVTLETVKVLKEKKKRGTVLNISSVAGYFQPYPNFTTYSATKSFVRSFSQGIDDELKGSGIRVLCSCPGQVDTSFRKKASKGILGPTNMSMHVNYAVKRMVNQINVGKSLDIFDWRFAMISYLNFLIPRKALAKSVDID